MRQEPPAFMNNCQEQKFDTNMVTSNGYLTALPVNGRLWSIG